MADLKGFIRLHKRLRDNPIWQRHDYGYCWVDLLLLANDAPREAFINGEKYSLGRGQLAWSLRTLEKQWDKSRNWLDKFLEFCRDEGMLKVDSNNRRTIITILNYDAYNPADGRTESDAEVDTDGRTEGQRNRERGIGNRKEERASATTTEAFSEIPSDETIQQYCADYRDLARGCLNGIGQVWWRGWLSSKLNGHHPFPKAWQVALKAAFTADLVARHPKALAALAGDQTNGVSDSAQPLTGNGENKKNGAAFMNGRSPAQARFELSKELESVQARLDAAHELGEPPKAIDRKRERELKEQLKTIGNEKSI